MFVAKAKGARDFRMPTFLAIIWANWLGNTTIGRETRRSAPTSPSPPSLFNCLFPEPHMTARSSSVERLVWPAGRASSRSCYSRTI
jgi:hypothetical protein